MQVGEHEKQLQIFKPSDLKIVAVSDTHGIYYNCENLMKDSGDIFIHAGDFTHYGLEEDFFKFFEFLDKLNFKHKIVLSGNHEISLDNGTIDKSVKNAVLTQFPCSLPREKILQQIKKRAIYLEHEAVEVEGLKIFGSPYTQMWAGTAFQYEPEEAHTIWDVIPEDIDILITHGPPYGILDKTSKKKNAGCKVLAATVEKIKPKVHIFGHIHEGRGIQVTPETTYMNVAYSPKRVELYRKDPPQQKE